MTSRTPIPAVDCSPTPSRVLRARVSEAFRVVQERFPFRGYMDGDLPKCQNIAAAIARRLPPAKAVRILDFGCGPCDKAAVLSALGYSMAGYDDLQDDWHKVPGNREAIMAFAKESGIDFRLAQGSLPWAPHTFDVVMLNDVLEHLHDSPRELLLSLLRLLKEHGLLVISVPNAVNIRKRIAVLSGHTNLVRFEVYYWYPGPWRGHIREYTSGDLRRLATYLGLNIVDLRSCDHMLGVLPGWARIWYRAVTSVFRGWKDSWLLVAAKASNWKAQDLTPEQIAVMRGKLGGSY